MLPRLSWLHPFPSRSDVRGGVCSLQSFGDPDLSYTRAPTYPEEPLPNRWPVRKDSVEVA